MFTSAANSLGRLNVVGNMIRETTEDVSRSPSELSSSLLSLDLVNHPVLKDLVGVQVSGDSAHARTP